MTNTRAGRGEEPLLSGLAVDGDVVSIDYEDQDPEFTQSDTQRSHEMPTVCYRNTEKLQMAADISLHHQPSSLMMRSGVLLTTVS